MPDAPTPGYAVRRLAWTEPVPGKFVRLPGGIQVAAFDNLAAAEHDRRQREAAVRAAVNPFDCVDCFYELSSLPGPILRDWLLDADLDPPPPEDGVPAWRTWWAAGRDGWQPDQLAAAWNGFDKLRFHDTTELPPAGRTVSVLLSVGYDYDYGGTYWQVARYAGGTPTASYRSAATAAEVCDAENGRRRAIQDPYDTFGAVGCRLDANRFPFHDRRLTPVGSGPNVVPFAEVVTVPRFGVESGRRESVFLVHRLSWAWSDPWNGGLWRASSADNSYGSHHVRADGVPVAAFGTRLEAEALCWELDLTARQFFNPFRFAHPATASSVPEAGFKALLRDEGLTPPLDDWSMLAWQPDSPEGVYDAARRVAWFDWWAANADLMAPAAAGLVWTLLDELRFHRVIELPLED